MATRVWQASAGLALNFGVPPYILHCKHLIYLTLGEGHRAAKWQNLNLALALPGLQSPPSSLGGSLLRLPGLFLAPCCLPSSGQS